MNCELYEIHDADLAEFCKAGQLFSLLVNLSPVHLKSWDISLALLLVPHLAQREGTSNIPSHGRISKS